MAPTDRPRETRFRLPLPPHSCPLGPIPSSAGSVAWFLECSCLLPVRKQNGNQLGLVGSRQPRPRYHDQRSIKQYLIDQDRRVRLAVGHFDDIAVVQSRFYLPKRDLALLHLHSGGDTDDKAAFLDGRADLV